MLSKFLFWLVLSTPYSALAIAVYAGWSLFIWSLSLCKRQRLHVITTAIIMNIIVRARARELFFLLALSILLEINYAIIFNIYGIQQRNSSHLLRIYSSFLHFSARCVFVCANKALANREKVYLFRCFFFSLLFSLFFGEKCSSSNKRK